MISSGSRLMRVRRCPMYKPHRPALCICHQLIFTQSFDTCTQPLGPLRQMLFSCLTCNPPPSSPTEPYTAAGVCYSCSISCHGDHNLVELFSKRNFVCDCGTSRLPSTRLCTLRINSMTGMKGNCHSETPAPGNKYNHNFRNEYCSCNKEYNPSKENGIMLQCLGLASEEEGGCGEDWWDPECLLGLAVSGQERFETKDETGPGDTINRDSATDKQTVEEKSLPPGFPDLDSFSSFICWKCLETFPEFKRYAGTEGFLGPVYRGDLASAAGGSNSEGQDEFDGSVRKRKAEDSEPQDSTSPKRAKSELSGEKPSGDEQSPTSLSNGCRFKSLPRATAPGTVFSMFLKSDFRSNLCRCTDCFPKLAKYPQLLEEEEVFEQPLSESDHEQAAGGSSTGSLLERGERALNNIDRVRAIG